MTLRSAATQSGGPRGADVAACPPCAHSAKGRPLPTFAIAPPVRAVAPMAAAVAVAAGKVTARFRKHPRHHLRTATSGWPWRDQMERRLAKSVVHRVRSAVAEDADELVGSIDRETEPFVRSETGGPIPDRTGSHRGGTGRSPFQATESHRTGHGSARHAGVPQNPFDILSQHRFSGFDMRRSRRNPLPDRASANRRATLKRAAMPPSSSTGNEVVHRTSRFSNRTSAPWAPSA